MEAVRTALAGKKTYIVAGATILLVLLETFGGIDIPGFTVEQDWLTAILAALGLSTLRAGMK